MYNILFVEDDDSIGFIVSKYKLWYQTNFCIKQMAANGQEASAILLKEKFDLVITDIRMPVINGLELIKLLRDRHDETCVILASNYSDFKYAKEGLRLGALDYIEKPYSEQKLAEALIIAEQYLSKKDLQSQFSIALHTYVSENKILEMLQWIIHQNNEVIDEVQQLKTEWEDIFANEPAKVEVMLNGLMEELWKHLTQIYPWLAYLENERFFIVEKVDGTIELENAMDKFLSISKQYELSKIDNTVNKICTVVTEATKKDNIADFVSEKLELSKDYIGKLLKAKMGMTLNEFITLVKMEQSKKLLKHSNLKVYEISEELGYSTVDYFSKLFKNHTGMTPAKYKKL